MESIVDMAIRSEQEAFMRGAEAGFWKGFSEGAEVNRRFIMGESDVAPDDLKPEEFRPLGKNYFPYTFISEQSR